PAERLEPPAQPAEDGGGGPAEAVPQRVVEQEDRDPGGEQGDDVGQEKGSPTVLVRHPREPPDVAEPDRRADRREDEPVLAAPLLPHRRRRLRLRHRYPHRSDPPASVVREI